MGRYPERSSTGWEPARPEEQPDGCSAPSRNVHDFLTALGVDAVAGWRRATVAATETGRRNRISGRRLPHLHIELIDIPRRNAYSRARCSSSQPTLERNCYTRQAKEANLLRGSASRRVIIWLLWLQSPSLWAIPPHASEVKRTAGGRCVSHVWQNLELCGWAGPKNTGCRKCRHLPLTTGRTIAIDGTVVDSEIIVGGLVIAAKDVIVRNCWIISDFGGSSGSGVITLRPGSSATIERSTLDGSDATHAGIWYEGLKLVAVRNEIIRVNDGVFSWDASNFTLKDNYLHDFTIYAANGHVDGFQTEGASHGTIRHNTFDVTQDQTSAIAIWNSRRNSDDILVDSNLIAGGGFSIYAEDYSPSESNPSGGYSVTNIRFSHNRFSTVHYPCVGNWGVWFLRGAPTDRWRRRGNVVLETGENIDNTNPHIGKLECR